MEDLTLEEMRAIDGGSLTAGAIAAGLLGFGAGAGAIIGFVVIGRFIYAARSID